jgi:hypothetical protein
MSTGTVIAARLPTFISKRYVEATVVNWLNELLEELSGEGLMKENFYERGVLVHDKNWILKPAGLRSIKRIIHPTDQQHEYDFEEIEGEIKLTKETVEDSDTTLDADSFSDSSVNGIKIYRSAVYDAIADQYKDYLFSIQVSTLDVYKNINLIIGGNTASSTTNMTLTWKHALTTALAAASVGHTHIVSPDYYLIMQYYGTYTAMTAYTDECPIDDRYERRIVDAWIRFKAEQAATGYSQEELASYDYYTKVLAKIQSEILSKPSPAKGRYFPSFPKAR